MITDCTFLSQSFLGHCSLKNLLRDGRGQQYLIIVQGIEELKHIHDVLLIFNLLSYFLYLLLTLNSY